MKISTPCATLTIGGGFSWLNGSLHELVPQSGQGLNIANHVKVLNFPRTQLFRFCS